MTAPVETIDFDAVFHDIAGRLEKETERRLQPPRIRLWDGDWNLRGEVKQEITASFQFLDADTGIGVIEMPLDYYLSRWCIDVDARAENGVNIHVTVDKDGARWSGRADSVKVRKGSDGRKIVRVEFKHDREELKYILVYPNPFLPPEVQFPKVWVAFGRSRWALKTTLLVNLMRLESSMWVLPDDPLDASKWFDFDQSTWWQVVKPDLTPDNSIGGIVHGRMKSVFEAGKKVLEDAQLTWECRRYLDGDPPPWEGANLRHGCLVWDLVDKSGWNTGTSFWGDMFSGLVRELVNINGDGITESVDQVPNPNVPEEYRTPGFKGTIPSMPGVIFLESENTGIQESEWEWNPATGVGSVAGGHSMPGVVCAPA